MVDASLTKRPLAYSRTRTGTATTGGTVKSNHQQKKGSGLWRRLGRVPWLAWILLAALIGLSTVEHRAPGVPSFARLDRAAATPDRDCFDFGSWREAQDFFERTGADDPHRLDRDRDGVACEVLR